MSADSASGSLRVALFSPDYAEYSARLARALSRRLEILLLLDHNNAARELSPTSSENLDGLNVRTFRIFVRQYGGLSSFLSLVSTLRAIYSFRPHIVHFQELSNPIAYLILLVMKRTTKIVVTVHDPLAHTGRDTETDRAWLRKRIRRSADLLLAHGRYCQDLLVKEASEFGVPVKDTRHGVLFIPPSEMLREPVSRRILFFGRMEAYKGLEVLLGAVEILAARKIEFSLHLAGQGSELTRLRARFERLPNVHVIEQHLEPMAVVAELQQASIVVMPYLDATQSGVTAAAFGNGRPVIASRVGGLTDVVTHGVNGLLVEPNDPAALAECLRTLLESDALSSDLRRGAVHTARTLMDWNDIADELAGWYRQLT